MDDLTKEQEERAMDLIAQNWGRPSPDLPCEQCGDKESPALALMGGEPICSTDCAIGLAEYWEDNGDEGAHQILTDLEDLIEIAAKNEATNYRVELVYIDCDYPGCHGYLCHPNGGVKFTTDGTVMPGVVLTCDECGRTRTMPHITGYNWPRNDEETRTA